MPHRTFINALAAAILAGSCPGAFAATEIAKGFDCPANASPEKVVRFYIEKGVIHETPYEVLDAIKTFEVKPGYTAFGFDLVAIAGWQESAFFGRAPGTAPPVHFALIVKANPWELGKAVREHGIKPQQPNPRMTYPHVTITPYNSQYPQVLPTSADQHAAYSSVSCVPRI